METFIDTKKGMDMKMKRIEIVRLPVVDLNVRFARHMGGNKYRHYTMSAAKAYNRTILDKNWSVLSELSMRIAEEEKERIVIDLIQAPELGVDEPQTLMVENVEMEVPNKKAKCFGTIEQLWTPNKLGRYIRDSFPTAERAMKVIDKFIWRQTSLTLFTRTDYRELALARYVGVKYFEDDEEQAKLILGYELFMLNGQGKIHGYLGGPVMRIEMVNPVGNTVNGRPVKVYVLASYPLIDSKVTNLRSRYLFEEGGDAPTIDGQPLEYQFEIETVEL